MSDAALADSWHWSQQILRTSRLKDYEGYEALAYLRMSGPDYYDTLGWIHRLWKPKKYVEIGVRDGASLAAVTTDTEVIAIDPKPNLDMIAPMMGQMDKLVIGTSDSYFVIEKNREHARGFDLAFIDGDHDAEQVRRDFENLEVLAHPGSLILLHDVVPMDAQTSTPRCQSSFWTGDAWRVMATIIASRPDLIAFTIACPPTGLGVVGRFGDPQAPVALPLPTGPLERNWDTVAHRLRIVPNEQEAIKAAFAGEYAAA